MCLLFVGVVSILSEGRLMKSWKAVRFGTPEEALRIQELDIPVPGDGQIAVQIRAASGVTPKRET